MVDFCPKMTGALIGTHSTGKRVATRVRCKSWYCPVCATQNKKQWTAVLLEYINTHLGTGWCWFTLTAHEDSHEETGEYSLLNLTRSWDRLIKRMKRKYGKFEYCRVYEEHKTGAYHLHAIRSGNWDDLIERNPGTDESYMDSPWLRKNARNLGQGYMTHADNLEAANSALAIYYVIKYMVKLNEQSKKGWGRVRRIQTSRGIKYKTASRSEYSWELKSGVYLRDLRFGRESIFLLNDGKTLDLDYFENEYVWPPDNEDTIDFPSGLA